MASEPVLQLKVAGATFDGVVVGFHGRDRICDLYEYEITVVASVEDAPVLTGFLGKEATLTLSMAHMSRDFKGIVQSVAHAGVSGERFALRVVPKLWLLGMKQQNRFFAKMTVLEIVQQVLQKHDVRFRSSAKTPDKRENCTQFNETDLAFVQRLLAEEGIAFYFDVASGEMVLADAPLHFAYTDPKSFPHHTDISGGYTTMDLVTRLDKSQQLGVGKGESRDYDETRPASPQTDTFGSVTPKLPGEVFFFGEHKFAGKGETHSLNSNAKQLERWVKGQTNEVTFTGDGTAIGFAAGLRAEVKPDVGESHNLLLVEVIHSATSTSVYSNSFSAVDASNGYIPLYTGARPRIYGAHSASVVKVKTVGSDNSHAEVRVKFPWADTEGECWARVAQLYAGNKWGSFFVPQVGQEVLVEFLNGNPDRPVVVGALYNKQNQIPPFKDTQSGIRTRSGKYNELRFDDKEGGEEVYLEAGKDFNFLINNDEKGEIKHDQTLDVKNNQTVDIGQAQKIKVGSTSELTAQQTITLKANTCITLQVGGSKIKIEPAGITLETGGSSIKMDPASVTVQSTMATVKGNATVELSGGGMTTIKGGLVKIN